MRYYLKELAKRFAYRSPMFNWLSRPRYPYYVEPATLAFLVNAITETKSLGGNIVEIGVARGLTTVFLNEHMSYEQDSRPYLCIDTFGGFTSDDIAHEVQHRGKNGNSYSKSFGWHDIDVFRKNVSQFPNVRVIQHDANHLIATDVGRVAVALLDVDLYRPIKNCLPALYDALLPGGYIVVDDVSGTSPLGLYDGAREAYLEFVAERNFPVHIVGRNGGVIRKPSSSS